jgi:hypothetical protein
MKLALSSMRRNTQVCDTLYLAGASMSIDSLCGPCDALLQLYGWGPIESRLRKRTVRLPPFRIVLEKPQLDHFAWKPVSLIINYANSRMVNVSGFPRFMGLVYMYR